MRNLGHGHVFPRDDGVRARCGGPGICAQCSRDAARVNTANDLPGWQDAWKAAIKEIESTEELFRFAHAQGGYKYPADAEREHKNLMNVLGCLKHKFEVRAGLTPDLSRMPPPEKNPNGERASDGLVEEAENQTSKKGSGQ